VGQIEMFRNIVYVLLMIIFSGSLAMGETSTAADWFNRADGLWDGKKFIEVKETMAYLDKAIEQQPNYANAYISRGMAYNQTGDYQRAIQDYNLALLFTNDENSLTKIFDKMGVAYANLGQYQRAINNFNHAISLKPDYADAYNNRGIVYFLQGDKKQCCNDAQKACELKNCELLSWARERGACP